MVMRNIFLVGIVIFSAVFFGCDPYRFRSETRNPVQCRIFSDPKSVEPNLYGFEMHPDAVLQVTSLAWTQFEFAGYFTLSGGEGFQLMLRPVIEESLVDSGFVLTFLSGGGVSLDSAGRRIDENKAFRFPRDSQTYVTIYNEESYLQVTVGCDTVVKRFTRRTSSDDIALRTLANSRLQVVDPEWKRIKFVKNFEVEAERSK
jgi:hypothetical protein